MKMFEMFKKPSMPAEWWSTWTKAKQKIMIVFHESRAGFETDHKRIFSSDLNLVLR